MKRGMIWTVSLGFLVLPLIATAMDHGKMSMDHGKQEMDHSGHMGDNIREATVDGYHLAYHLIDNKAQMEKMKDMKGHDMSQLKSHHLMLYVMGPDGKFLADGKVGFKVEGPGGTEQKVMAMAMPMGTQSGFGTDVEMKDKGRYEIKTKIVAGDVKLTDEFKYTVE